MRNATFQKTHVSQTNRVDLENLRFAWEVSKKMTARETPETLQNFKI